jgi:hypothetical protein
MAHGLSVHLPEFQDGRDQADKQEPEYESAQDQKLVGAHFFLPINAASLK